MISFVDNRAGPSRVCTPISARVTVGECGCVWSSAEDVGAIIRLKFRVTIDWDVRTMSTTMALTRSSMGAICDSTIARICASTKRGSAVRL